MHKMSFDGTPKPNC